MELSGAQWGLTSGARERREGASEEPNQQLLLIATEPAVGKQTF